ncbi:MAG: cytochrome c3 family protein [Desulfonauticus sp.]|nr:cytochrome c3 family protein [Desulfonauticus sp.]
MHIREFFKSYRESGKFIFKIMLLVSIFVWASGPIYAGNYLNSAHGNSNYGVKRTGISQYPRGHCAHCHEQHASINGAEPVPINGAVGYLLFSPNYTSQTVNFCFDCHVQTGGYQEGGGIINRSYSYNFGGNTDSYDNDLKQAFSHTAPGSSHNLNDIKKILGTTMYDANGHEWSLPKTLNPCDACHNPHIVQRNYPVSNADGKLKTAVTRPSNPNQLWGDDEGERMNRYGDYQAPYWYGSDTDDPKFEPAGDEVQDGSNLPDFVRLCTDCHNGYNQIWSSRLGRYLLPIKWFSNNGDIHGVKRGFIKRPRPPYSYQQHYTLSCTDCHEPHGSSNIFLLRTSINGKSISVSNTDDESWRNFCYGACHNYKHNKRNCFECHHHNKKF